MFHNACLTYIIKYYDGLRATHKKAPIPFNVVWTDNCPGQYRCRQNFLNVARASGTHDNKVVVVHKLAEKYRFKGSWDATGKLVKERIMNNELKYDRCSNAMDCYLKLTRDLTKDGKQTAMVKMEMYEKNGDPRIIKNTTFTTKETHIGFGTEDIEQYNSLSSNPKYKHIVHTPRDNVPDMDTIKGTTLIAQVSGCRNPNEDGRWTLDHSLLPCSCPECRKDPTDYKSCMFQKDRETKRVVITLEGESKNSDKNDLYDLKSLTKPQLKDELRARGLSLSGNKPELLERLTQVLTVEHDLGEEAEDEGDIVIMEQNDKEDEGLEENEI